MTYHSKKLSEQKLIQLTGAERLHLTHLVTEPAGPRVIRRLSMALSLIIFALIYWVTATKIEELTQASGEIIPSGFLQVIQHYDGGTLRNVYVKEGEIVKKGDKLLELHSLGIEEELESSRVALDRYQRSYDLNTEMMDMREKLVADGLISKMEYLKSKKELLNIEADISQQEQLIQKLKKREGRLVIYAPVSGIVKGLAVNTVGEVIKSGATLMEVVPTEEELVAEVRIMPQDIGHVTLGQPVRIKVSSYDFGRYGTINGVVELLTASTVKDLNGDSYYKAHIKLDTDHVGEFESLKIMPGMTVEAGIITGEKTVFEYLLKPIQHALTAGLTER